MAEKFEEESKFEEAIKAYQKAVDYFTMDSKNSYPTYRNDCKLKVADLTCESLGGSLESFPHIVNVRDQSIHTNHNLIGI